jgi:hypothetical protein
VYGATTLTFTDWPATIAIDNLTVTYSPEPASIVLLGTLCAGVVWSLRRRTKTQSAG